VTEGQPPTAWEHDCGAELRPKTVCAHCGKPVTPQTTQMARLDLVR
jgi:hypothetical protein